MQITPRLAEIDGTPVDLSKTVGPHNDIPRFFIDRPIFAIVLSVLMMIGGIVSFFQLPLSEYPAVTPPTVQVTTAYPGANPDVIAQTVATPLEQAITGVEGCCTCPRSRPPTGE